MSTKRKIKGISEQRRQTRIASHMQFGANTAYIPAENATSIPQKATFISLGLKNAYVL